ncbi:hypothetical protein AQJ23_16320 [Streptomyces antibioticus]|nr:hypothetical protein [Streptomyces antibioticus]KUN25451.1 hypothetical protein AQJ23_16320 [Streptomyces antibioticus]
MTDKQEPAEISGLTVIPAGDLKPEDMGVLSVRYVDGAAQLVVSGGFALPAHLPVVDTGGALVAAYLPASPAAAAQVSGGQTGEAKGLIMQPDGNCVLYTK